MILLITQFSMHINDVTSTSESEYLIPSSYSAQAVADRVDLPNHTDDSPGFGESLVVLETLKNSSGS